MVGFSGAAPGHIHSWQLPRITSAAASVPARSRGTRALSGTRHCLPPVNAEKWGHPSKKGSGIALLWLLLFGRKGGGKMERSLARCKNVFAAV